MTRIRCKPTQKEQAVLFCENNNIPFYNSNENDLVFVSMKDVYEVSTFLNRLDELDKIDHLKKEIFE